MTKPKGKFSEKDTDSASLPPASITMADISLLRNNHREALAANFKSSFESLASSLVSIHSMVTDHGQRTTSLETKATEADTCLRQLEEVCAALKKDNESFKAKSADLEGRSRNRNLGIVGLPESIDGPRPSEFFSQLLVDVLGKDILHSPPELDRAHRSLAPKPAAGERPRPVILRFHHFKVKDLVICEARKRGDLIYKDQKICFYEDYSPDVLKQRSEYKSCVSELYKCRYKPSLLYPARLCITLPSVDIKWLRSAAEADKFVQNLDSNS